MIVVGFTPKPQGWAALAAGIAESRLRAAPLLVLNASKGDALVDPALASDDDLTRARAELDGAGVPYELVRDLSGDGAERLLAAAEQRAATLLVIGIRHRSATGKLLFGSDAQRVLLDAPCPVLAVKAG